MMNYKINDLKSDTESGSSELILKLVELYIDAIKNNNNLEQTKRAIINAKPSMAGIKNVLNLIDEIKININDPEQIKSNILEKLHFSRLKTIDDSVKFLCDNKIQFIFTCSYSSTVLEIIKKYSVINSNVKLIAINSIWKNTNYATFYSQKLLKHLKNITLLDLNKMEFIPNSVGLLGADAIIPDKFIINGFPSLNFAKKLKKLNIQLIIAAEKFKFIDKILLEDGFEKIPIEYITKIISY